MDRDEASTFLIASPQALAMCSFLRLAAPLLRTKERESLKHTKKAIKCAEFMHEKCKQARRGMGQEQLIIILCVCLVCDGTSRWVSCEFSSLAFSLETRDTPDVPRPTPLMLLHKRLFWLLARCSFSQKPLKKSLASVFSPRLCCLF
jgi:hypothetical protein